MASLSKLSLSQTSISFSSSLSSSSFLQWRPSTALPSKPRRKFTKVSVKIREIFMPALSSTMTEGKIVTWSKSEGDILHTGESVVVVESDKADIDVETFYDGILATIVVPEGETAPVYAPIGILAETEAEIEEAKARASQSGTKLDQKVDSSPSPSPSLATLPNAPPTELPPDGGRKGVATPYAKKLVKQYKVDLRSIVVTHKPKTIMTPSNRRYSFNLDRN